MNHIKGHNQSGSIPCDQNGGLHLRGQVVYAKWSNTMFGQTVYIKHLLVMLIDDNNNNDNTAHSWGRWLGRVVDVWCRASLPFQGLLIRIAFSLSVLVDQVILQVSVCRESLKGSSSSTIVHSPWWGTPPPPGGPLQLCIRTSKEVQAHCCQCYSNICLVFHTLFWATLWYSFKLPWNSGKQRAVASNSSHTCKAARWFMYFESKWHEIQLRMALPECRNS